MKSNTMQKTIIFLLLLLLVAAGYIIYNQERSKPENVLRSITKELEQITPEDIVDALLESTMAFNKPHIDFAVWLGIIELDTTITRTGAGGITVG